MQRSVCMFHSAATIPCVSVKPSSFQFVPRHDRLKSEELKFLQDFVGKASNLFVLTGAGISTESGIPDYRSEGVGLYARTNHQPMKIQDFMASNESRKRYWARNFVGWPTFSARTPNLSHTTLEEWRRKRKVSTIVTQNVDRLHHKAGSIDTIELHGSAYVVTCLSCHHQMDRQHFQEILEDANPDFVVGRRRSEVRPDGDVFLADNELRNFVLPQCHLCHGGILKPDIVFFGDNVSKLKVQGISERLSSCDAVLVLGSSLQVFSSYRFVLQAKQLNLPIAILTLGQTRADQFAELKLAVRLGEILPLIKV